MPFGNEILDFDGSVCLELPLLCTRLSGWKDVWSLSLFHPRSTLYDVIEYLKHRQENPLENYSTRS